MKLGDNPQADRDALIANIGSHLAFAVRTKGTKEWRFPSYPAEKYRSLRWEIAILGKKGDENLRRLGRLNEKI